MKKIFVLCLVICLSFGLIACESAQTPEPSTPASTPEPEEQPPFVTYSPYAITVAARELMGEDYALYCDLIDALLNYDNEVSGFTDESQFWGIWCTLRDEFPPARNLLADFGDTNEPYVFLDGTVTLEYQLDEESHKQILKNYGERIQEDLSILTEEDSEVEMIARLYSRASNAIRSGENAGSVYDAIMSGIGTSRDNASYLVVLLNHIDVECYRSVGFGEGVEASHEWVTAKMEGAFYHFDPAWQQDFYQWYWFAVDDNLRKASLKAKWKLEYLIGGNPEAVTGEGVVLESTTNWIALNRLELPECPESYKPDSRDPTKFNQKEPWTW